jgi:hypothetical protein
MTVTDANGKVFNVLVRQENFEKSIQTYAQNVAPVTELDDWGNFWVRCIRLQGQVGRIVVQVEALVECNKIGEQVAKFDVKGEQTLMLCVGKPASLVLRGRKMKRCGAGGVGESTQNWSQLLHSQAPEVFIRCQSFVQLDPLVVDVVDECGNLIPSWKGKVILDFKGSGIERSAVVSSRKTGGLPAEQVLHLEKGDACGMQMLGLTFKEAGSYLSVIRSLGLPDLPVCFEVSPGNVVTSLELIIDDDVDLERLHLGARVSALVNIQTEDGAALTELDKTAMIFYIESCRELQVCRWEFKGGSLRVDLQLPQHTCVSEIFALYSETREDYKPKPSDVESNRLAVQVLAGPVDHISLQSKKGNESLLIASEHQLSLPPLLIAALDELENKSSTLQGGAVLECFVVPEIECPNGELKLIGEKSFRLSAAVNPVTIKDVHVVRHDGAAIDFCEFLINFRVEPASLAIAPLTHSFTHSNNESISRKIKSLQEREQQLQEQHDEAQRLATDTNERMTARCQQGFPENEADWKREKEKLKQDVLDAKQELLLGERDMAAEPSRHDVDVAGLQGVIGVAADLGVIDRIPGHDAGEVRKCITWAFKMHHANVLFRSQRDIDDFDQLHLEGRASHHRVRRIYCAETLLEGPKQKAPVNIEGCIAFAQDLILVNQSLVHEPEDVQAVRKFLNIIFGNLLIFSEYNKAVHYHQGMVLQKKRIPRLVGLDRPFDIIDTDGGRSVVSRKSCASAELAALPAMGIVAFGSSSIGRHLRSRGEAASKLLREFDKLVLVQRSKVVKE